MIRNFLLKFRRIFRSVRWRFIFIFIFLVALAFTITAFISARLTEENLLTTRISEMSQVTSRFSNEIADDLSESNASNLYNASIEYGQEHSCRIVIVNKAGIVQVDSFSKLNTMKISSREAIEVLTGSKADSLGYHRLEDDRGNSFWAVYFASAVIKNTDTIGAVIISQSLQDIIEKTQAATKNYLLIFSIITAIIVILSYYLTNHISRPIDELRRASLQIAGGDYKTRVLPKGNNEITELAETFNIMSRRLQNVDKQRNQFVSNASHELKTPLASIKLFVESLIYQDSELSQEVMRDFLKEIDNEVDRLTNLVNDMLYLTKIDAETDIIDVENVDIGNLISQILVMLQPIAAKKNIELEMEQISEAYAECNPVMIRQAISNLVDNAVKYTNDGGNVKVSVDTDDTSVYIKVKDNGVGIAKEHIQHLFDRFYRVDKARSRSSGGTGLGLDIANTIAVIHGGKIEVRSELGVGTEFTFILPKTYSKKKN